MKYIDIEKHISLAELPLVATLSYLGFKIIALNTNHEGRVFFLFETAENLNNAIRDYWDGKLAIEPKVFWALSRELKSRMRSEANAAF